MIGIMDYLEHEGGHMNIVQLMIECGANDWNSGLSGACEGGHIVIVQLMIERGATYCNHCHKTIAEHTIQ